MILALGSCSAKFTLLGCDLELCSLAYRQKILANGVYNDATHACVIWPSICSSKRDMGIHRVGETAWSRIEPARISERISRLGARLSQQKSYQCWLQSLFVTSWITANASPVPSQKPRSAHRNTGFQCVQIMLRATSNQY